MGSSVVDAAAPRSSAELRVLIGLLAAVVLAVRAVTVVIERGTPLHVPNRAVQESHRASTALHQCVARQWSQPRPNGCARGGHGRD